MAANACLCCLGTACTEYPGNCKVRHLVLGKARTGEKKHVYKITPNMLLSRSEHLLPSCAWMRKEF